MCVNRLDTGTMVPYLTCMATTTAHKEQAMNHELNIQIRKAFLEYTKLSGPDRFLPGVYERTIARQTSMLEEAIAAAKSA